MSWRLPFFTVFVINGLRLFMCPFFDSFYVSAIPALLPLQSSDVKDVGYVIVRFPYFSLFALLTISAEL